MLDSHLGQLSLGLLGEGSDNQNLLKKGRPGLQPPLNRLGRRIPIELTLQQGIRMPAHWIDSTRKMSGSSRSYEEILKKLQSQFKVQGFLTYPGVLGPVRHLLALGKKDD